MEDLESRVGYRFRDAGLLETALTHPSFCGDRRAPHYQRLEFLGDAVLELAISRHLYYELPELNEGRLTRLRAELVREETLHRIALKWGLGRHVRLSVGEEKSGGREKPSILSDVVEAIFAAVYLDGGVDAAFGVVLRAFSGMLAPSELSETLDAKTRLQELLQSEGRMPEYEMLAVDGPPHAPEFRYRVRAGEEPIGEGAGRSKQAAQQAAARAALSRLEQGH